MWSKINVRLLRSNSFCGEDEDKDPGEEFEEYLACAVCGDNCESLSILPYANSYDSIAC